MFTKIKSCFAFLCPKNLRKGLYCFVIVFLCFSELKEHAYFLVREGFLGSKHYFLVFPKIQPKLNDYALVYSPWHNEKIIKQVIGTAGSFVWFNQHSECFVDKQRIGGLFRLGFDKSNLHPIQSQEIPNEYVFLYDPDRDSFDSRYQEFGLIRISELHGKVIHLWST